MKTILIKLGLLISMLVNANLLFSQDSYGDSDNGLFATLFLGFGTEMYNNNSNGQAFSLEIAGGAGKIGGSFDLNINDAPTLDLKKPNYIDLKDCIIMDWKLLMQYFPFKIRRIFNPYLQTGLGYSTLERNGKAYVLYNNPLYNQGTTENMGKYFISELGAGLTIVAFKHLAIKVEYSKSFFRNPDYLNGQQLIVKLGLHNWIN